MKKTTGISKLAVSLRWSPDSVVPVGTLYRSSGTRAILFEHDETFLKKKISLSPFHLATLSGATQARTDELPFFGLHGVFADSLPDGWGLLVMAQAMRRMGLRYDEATALDKLAFIGTKGLGALTYEPNLDSPINTSFALNLAALSDDAHQILEGSSADVLSEILLIGGSPGGARPKIVAEIKTPQRQNDFYRGPIISGHTTTTPEGYEPWLIKFAAKGDERDAALTEFLYARTAKKVGIDVEPTALFRDSKGRIWFGMRRFDRLPGNRRRHLHSLAGLLHANFRVPSLDYEAFLKATYILTRSKVEAEKAFRLALFNAIFHNRDDHAKNFSFLMDESGEWRLAPAYDLTWSAGPGGEHTMSYLGEGRSPRESHFVELAKRVDISQQRAHQILDEVRGGIDLLKKGAKEMGAKSILKRFSAR